MLTATIQHSAEITENAGADSRQAFTPPAITGLILGRAGCGAFVGELSRDRERNGQIYSDFLRFSQMRAPQFRGRGRGGRGRHEGLYTFGGKTSVHG